MASNWTNKFDFNQMKDNAKEADKQDKKNFSDSRFWKLTVNSDNEGSAVIRFLPDPVNKTTWKKYFEHAFQYDLNGKTKWYIDNCATSIGGDCPVCEKNREYWNSPYDADAEKGKARKRKVKFISNILVLKDPARPENEGKVFLFKYGPQIQSMYETAMFGDKAEKDALDDDDGGGTFNPCDFNKGADFLYRATPGNSRFKFTYEMSKFKRQTPLFDGLEDDERDVKIGDVMESAYNTNKFPPEESYPTVEQVRSKLGAELGVIKSTSKDETKGIEDDNSDDEPTPKANIKVVTKEKESVSDFIDNL